MIDHAAAAGKLDFFPKGADIWVWITFVGGWMTMMLGSIPQQDVFQRVMSAKDVRAATRGPVIGGLSYIAFAFVLVAMAAWAYGRFGQAFGKLASPTRLRFLSAV